MTDSGVDLVDALSRVSSATLQQSADRRTVDQCNADLVDAGIATAMRVAGVSRRQACTTLAWPLGVPPRRLEEWAEHSMLRPDVMRWQRAAFADAVDLVEVFHRELGPWPTCVAAFRRRVGIFQQGLARVLGVDLNNICAWEHGRTGIAPRHYWRLVKCCFRAAGAHGYVQKAGGLILHGERMRHV